jgi:hypothetical protein
VIPLVFRSFVAVAIPLALSIKRYPYKNPESESAREKKFTNRDPDEISERHSPSSSSSSGQLLGCSWASMCSK